MRKLAPSLGRLVQEIEFGWSCYLGGLALSKIYSDGSAFSVNACVFILCSIVGFIDCRVSIGNWVVETIKIIRSRRECAPPGLAECLLQVFGRAKDIEALVGDISQRFNEDVHTGMSTNRAKRRYWGRVLRSIWPLFKQCIKRAGILGLMFAAIKKLF